MKKLIFIVIVILGRLLISSFIFAEDLFSKYSRLNLYADTNHTFATDTITPFGEFRFSLQENKTNFGICATSSKITKTIPFTIKAGNLSTGGILSKMNNPLLSTSTSPFSSGGSDINSITTSLPGNTSFSKPVSTFCELSFLQKKSTVKEIKINGFYIPETQIAAFSLYNKMSFFKEKLKLELAGCTGSFPYEENSISSWFSKELYYHQGTHFCSCFQFSLNCQNLSSIFTTALYETPFGTLSSLYRLDNKITTRRFIINLSTLYNPNISEEKIITSSEKVINDCLQLRCGIQYKFVTGINRPVFVKSGFQTYADIRLSQTVHPLKFAAGVQLSSSLFSLSLISSINTTINSENRTSQNINFESVNFQIKNSWYIKNLTPSLTLSAGINPNDDFTVFTKTYKASSSLTYTKIPKITASGTISVTQKNQEYTSKKAAGTISAKFTWRKINIILKGTGNFEL